MPRKLLNLAADNRGKSAGLRAETAGDDTTTVYVYDVIDSWWGISAADFARELGAISTPNVVLRINSPGGDVFEARAMMAAIADHPATVTARIDGLCASAATALSLACDSVEIVEGGFYMIHKAWSFAMGNADEMRATADLLDKVDTVLVNGYVEKTGIAEAEIRSLMKAETWYDADGAVNAGFCDAKIAIPTGGKGKSADARAFNLSAFANTPTALTETRPEPPFDDAARQKMLARLGLYERTAD